MASSGKWGAFLKTRSSLNSRDEDFCGMAGFFQEFTASSSYGTLASMCYVCKDVKGFHSHCDFFLRCSQYTHHFPSSL